MEEPSWDGSYQTETKEGQTETELGQTEAELGQTEAEKGQIEAEVGQTEAVVGLKVSNSIVKNRGGDMFSILSWSPATEIRLVFPLISCDGDMFGF